MLEPWSPGFGAWRCVQRFEVLFPRFPVGATFSPEGRYVLLTMHDRPPFTAFSTPVPNPQAGETVTLKTRLPMDRGSNTPDARTFSALFASFQSALAELRGRPLAYEGMVCDPHPVVQGENRLWSGCRVRLAVDGFAQAVACDGCPPLDRLFEQWATRGDAGVSQLRRLLDLLDDYGASALAAAVEEALTRDAPSAGTIAHLLDQQRRRRGLPPVVPLVLPNHPGVQDLNVQPHALETYDALTRPDPDDAA